MEITIKEVPRGCSREVRNAVRAVIKRFLESKIEKPQVDMSKFDLANDPVINEIK